MLSDEMSETLHDWFEIPTKDALFAEVGRWLIEHDSAVEAAARADQIERDLAIVEMVRARFPNTYSVGDIKRAIRAQLSVPVTPGGEK